MSDLGKEQGQSQVLPSVPTDKAGSDYDAETEVADSSRSCKEEKGAKSFKFECCPRVRWLAVRMYLVFKEVALVLFLAFTYAALTNDPPKVSKSPAAFPFFPKTSVVTDWYRGQLGAAIDKARESDIAFVMFYAPWDAESQVVRKEFDLAARYMRDEITFAAVNCWQPGSECRKQYTKAYNWPVLIAYPSHGKGIQYKGPRSAAHISKFLMSVSRPFIRLAEELEVYGLLSSYDAAIVGCVNASPGSLDYAVLYTVALRFLEKDPFREVAFAVLTGQNHTCFDTPAPTLMLHMWNETLWYPSDGEWKPDALLAWILKNLHQVSMWITPSGSKSLTLFNYVQPGPVLMLFTPRNPLAAFVDYYDLLHEVALEYYNCNDKHGIMLNSFLVRTRRVENYLKYIYFLKKCFLQPESEKSAYPPVVTSTTTDQWFNSSCCPLPSKISEDTCSKCEMMDMLKQQSHWQCDSFKESASPNFKKAKPILGENFAHFEIMDDPKLPQNLQKLWKARMCRIGSIAHNILPPIFSTSVVDEQNLYGFKEKHVNITGLACKTNMSLTLIALDSLKHYHFAERLGVDLAGSKDKTAVVIINEKMETHHILQEPLNDVSLREFVLNFTVNSLPRSFKSLTSIKTKHTHVYPYRKNSSSGLKELCLVELDSKTFLSTVLQQNKAVMVLYYSKQCSFCNGISYTFLTAAKIFSSMNSLMFARIDGDLNVLPWEFTMDSYPTIILFPARQKSESRAFPRDMPITVPNLVRFILVNIDSTLKLQAMWTLCNEAKYESEKESCIASVRAENLSLIDHTLHALRALRNLDVLTKNKLLYRLQQLRSINLLLAYTPENAKDIRRHMAKLHKLPIQGLQGGQQATKNAGRAFPRDEL